MIQTFCTECHAVSAQRGPVFACTSCAPEGVDLVAGMRAALSNLPPERAREIWRVIDALDDDILRTDYPDEFVAAELRDMGLDPEALAERGVEFVAGIKERR